MDGSTDKSFFTQKLLTCAVSFEAKSSSDLEYGFIIVTRCQVAANKFNNQCLRFKNLFLLFV